MHFTSTEITLLCIAAVIGIIIAIAAAKCPTEAENIETEVEQHVAADYAAVKSDVTAAVDETEHALHADFADEGNPHHDTEAAPTVSNDTPATAEPDHVDATTYGQTTADLNAQHDAAPVVATSEGTPVPGDGVAREAIFTGTEPAPPVATLAPDAAAV